MLDTAAVRKGATALGPLSSSEKWSVRIINQLCDELDELRKASAGQAARIEELTGELGKWEQTYLSGGFQP